MSGERLDQLMTQARTRLREGGVDTPDLDAQLLVEWATGATRLYLISWPEKLIDEDKVAQLNEALERRIAGEPVHRNYRNARVLWSAIPAFTRNS